MCVDPLIWWWTHEAQFPNVNFIAKQFFCIFGFQIEIERILAWLAF
jgi:hypothetical protein